MNTCGKETSKACNQTKAGYHENRGVKNSGHQTILIEKQGARRLLDVLEHEQREIIYLFYIEELSETETASVLSSLFGF